MRTRVGMVGVVVGLVATPVAHAASAVNVTDGGNAGAGTLRQALIDVDEGGTVNLQVPTVTLTASIEILDKTVTIDGQGVNTSTITGNGSDFQLLVIDDTSVLDAEQGDHSVTITDVTIKGGRYQNAGGALGNAHKTALTLRNVALLDNRGGEGGAVDLAAPFTLENVLAQGNVATATGSGSGAGGAFQITRAGSSSMTNVTIVGNTATGNDGGAFNLSAGSAPAGEHTDLTITNSTIANNTTTTDDQGAGFRVGSNNTVTLANTVIAGNTDPGGLDNCYIAGLASITSNGHNASDAALGTTPATCNLTAGSDLLSVATPLAPMFDLGGPFDTTFLLPAGALIDGATGCSSTDGRGLTRGATCDIGAIELTLPSSSTTLSDAVTQTGAHMSGSADGNGLPAQAHYEYGPTDSYGTSTALVAIAAGAAVPTDATLTGLTPATTYHVRLVVQSTDGKVNGADATFTTAATPVTDPGTGGGGTPTTPGGTTTPPGGGGSTTTPPSDTTPPTTKLALRKTKLKDIIRARAFSVACRLNEAGTCKIVVTVDALAAKKLGLGKSRRLGTATAKNGVATIKLSKPRAVKLGRLKRIVLKVAATLTDSAGNKATKTAGLIAKR